VGYMTQPLIVDAHLDMSYHAMYTGRDLRQTVQTIRALKKRSDKNVQTSFPDMKAAGVAIVFGTIFTENADPGWGQAFLANAAARSVIPIKTYHNAQEAREQAIEHLEIYQRWQDQGLLHLITSQASLKEHLEAWQHDKVLGVVLLMEGADPILDPDDLAWWFGQGLRIVGLCWGRSRYAGGTGVPGGLTPIGRELLSHIKQLKVIHDISHLDEQAFWEALELGHHRIISSHSNARALLLPPDNTESEIPLNRHLSDAMIRALGEQDAVLGINLLNSFLDPRVSSLETRGIRVSIHDQVKRQLEHMASLVGWQRLGIGSDTDAGAGREETPEELDTIHDWIKLGEVVPLEARAGFLGGNWLRLLSQALPEK
jgi:membrane dipeptidase